MHAHTLRHALLELDPLAAVEILRTNKIVFVNNGIRVAVSRASDYNKFMIALFEQEQLDKNCVPHVVFNPLDSGDMEIQMHNFMPREVRSILHVSAGSHEWEPSTEELEELTRIFMETEATAHATIISTLRDVNPSLYSVYPDTVLVVTVGSPDWNPTDGELADVKKMFVEARTADPIGAVVATRYNIKVETRTVENPAELVEVRRFQACAE